MSFDRIWRGGNIFKEPLPQIRICSSTFNCWCSGYFMCCLHTLTLYLNLVLPTPVSPIHSSKQPEQITTEMTLKLMQDIGELMWMFFTCLSVYSLDSKNESQHCHRESLHFLTPTSSLLNSALVSSFLRLGGFKSWNIISLNPLVPGVPWKVTHT